MSALFRLIHLPPPRQVRATPHLDAVSATFMEKVEYLARPRPDVIRELERMVDIFLREEGYQKGGR